MKEEKGHAIKTELEIETSCASILAIQMVKQMRWTRNTHNNTTAFCSTCSLGLEIGFWLSRWRKAGE